MQPLETTPQVPGCATSSRSLGESPTGSATPMRSWLMVEHQRAWSADEADRLFAGILPPARQRVLRDLQRRARLRPLLIRRPGVRVGASSPRRTVLVGGAGGGRRWLERLEIEDLRELAGLDLGAIVEGRGGLGEPVTGPLFAVCTHGAKDLCCATYGRPVARELAAAAPGRVWETTHLGGDRFAGNVLVVPDGFLYGHVSGDSAGRVAAAALDGRVLPDLLRGRTSASMPAQAAEIAVRRVTGLDRVDDVEPVDEDPATGVVTVRAGDRWIEVTIGRHPLGVCGTSRCAGESSPCGWSVSRLVDVPAPPLARAV